MLIRRNRVTAGCAQIGRFAALSGCRAPVGGAYVYPAEDTNARRGDDRKGDALSSHRDLSLLSRLFPLGRAGDTRAPSAHRRRSVRRRRPLIPHTVLAPFFWALFRARARDERAWCYPTGPSDIWVPGVDPARVLVIGDGPAAGCGVLTQEIGIAGHLARDISARLERGVEVTVVAEPAASARSTLHRLDELDLRGYDSIVVMLATTDALCLTPRRSWHRDIGAVVHTVASTDAASVFVTSTARLDRAVWLAPFARRLTGRHARILDIETRRICAESGTPVIPLDAAEELTSRTYARWSTRISEHVARSLDHGGAG